MFYSQQIKKIQIKSALIYADAGTFLISRTLYKNINTFYNRFHKHKNYMLSIIEYQQSYFGA